MNDTLNESNIVKEYEFFKPKFDEVDYLFDNVIKGFRKNCFHSFEYRCVYDIQFTNITSNKEFFSPISLRYIELKSEYYGLSKKVKIARNSVFVFNEIVNLTKKVCSSLSRMNIRYYLKFHIPIMQRQFCRIMSQNREYINTYCSDLHNLFQFARTKCHLDNQ